MCLFLGVRYTLPAVCISLSEFPIASEKLGQWADEIRDAADWEVPQAVFSRVLQSSGQIAYAVLMCGVRP